MHPGTQAAECLKHSKAEESKGYFEPCEPITDEQLQQAEGAHEKSEHSEKGTISSCLAHTVLPPHSQVSPVCTASTSLYLC